MQRKNPKIVLLFRVRSVSIPDIKLHEPPKFGKSLFLATVAFKVVTFDRRIFLDVCFVYLVYSIRESLLERERKSKMKSYILSIE